VKNHDFTPKNHIFSYFRGGGRGAPVRPPLDPPMSLIVQSSLSLNCRGCFIISLITYIQVESKVLVSSYINVIDLNCQKKKDKVHLPFYKFTRIATNSLKLHYNFTTVNNIYADFQQVHVLKFVHAVSL
jgi:hypothetical protein